ncbi:siroheme synthase CysG [Desertibaculum subflavum]|uniref:siroheme synthase CysG n=1 Tax=Desertibaculum subflavum TaxID=2268458 RepID=UPI000E67440D
MRHLPAFHDVRGRIVVVVGTSAAADAKAALAATAGARLRRVAKLATDDLRDAALVFVATGDAGTDAAAASLANSHGKPVNVVDRADLGTFVMGAVVDRDPVTVAISTAGAAPMLAQHLRRRVEAAIPAGFGAVASLLGRARERIRRAAPQPGERRRLYRRLIEGRTGQLALAGRSAEAAAALAHELAAADLPRVGTPAGRVYLVGAGPGDPELLTVKALRLIGEADVIVHDRLVDPAILDRARRDAELVFAGKACGNHSMPQAEINALLVRLGREGRRVVRLKGGDPFVFGRGGEEAEALAEAGIGFEIVPGITAALGCAAYAGLPLTHRDFAQSCLLVTAHSRKGRLDVDWTALTRPNQTAAIYMGLGALAELADGLIARGVAPSVFAAVIDRGTRTAQKVVVAPLAELGRAASEAHLEGPALVIVGEVARLAPALHWFGAAPVVAEQPARLSVAV